MAIGGGVRTDTVKRFTVDTLVPCFASHFFPQYDIIIYSDVDCVFMDDISDILDIDIENRYLAGVRSPFLKMNNDELAHLNEEHYLKLKNSYFAGGIWLLNLRKIREDSLEEKMLAVINDDNIVKRWPDQDIMNIACDNNVAYIPLNYIAYPYLIMLLYKEDFASHYSREELYDSIIHPKIIHYAAVKPWKSKIYYDEIWWTIFYYLQLPKTSIITREIDSDKKLIKKIQRYRRLSKLLAITSIGLLAVIIGYICM